MQLTILQQNDTHGCLEAHPEFFGALRNRCIDAQVDLPEWPPMSSRPAIRRTGGQIFKKHTAGRKTWGVTSHEAIQELLKAQPRGISLDAAYCLFKKTRSWREVK